MESELLLIRPSKSVEKEIWSYRQEYFDFNEAHINGSYGMAGYDNFDQWLRDVTAIEKDVLSKHGTHASTFFSVRKADGKIIGSIQLRHFLTPQLKESGGHIGYGVRPLERKKGYGRQQLMLVLDEARALKIPHVLISCDKDNVASAKTAISCGGTLVCENVYEGRPQQFYRIEL